MLQPEPLQPTVQEAPKVTPPRRKLLRRILWGFGILIGFILLSAILIPLLFEDQIKRIFINELNKSLATPVVVKEDDIDLTILKNFPDATVVFKNIGIRESVENSEKNFLEAKKISLLFNVMDIMRGNYVIQDIIVSDGYCNLLTDKQGNINYKFWKDGAGDSSEEFTIDLQQVICRKMDFNYRDFKHKQDIILYIHESNFKGNFSSDVYRMSVTGDILSKRISISGTNYLVDQETEVQTDIGINVPEDNYTFENGSVIIDKNKFLVNGSINLHEKNYYDLAVQGDRISMEALLLLLPGNTSKQLAGIKSNGKVDFKTTIKGYDTAKENPGIVITFAIDNATIQHEKFGDKLTDVSFEGSYTNGEKHNAQTSAIVIKNFSGKQKNNPLTFSLNYKNFANPFIDLQLNGDMPASLLIPFAVKDLKDVDGMISLKDIHVNGNIKSFSTSVANAQPAGEIIFQDLAFNTHGQDVKIGSGTAKVMNNQIELQELHVSLGGSDIVVNLSVTNWIQSVFPSETKPALNMSGTLQSENINLNNLIAVFQPAETETPEQKQEATNTIQAESSMLNFSGEITANVNALQYDQLQFKNISTSLQFSPGMIAMHNLRCNTMNGACELKASLRELGNGILILETSGTLSSIDITQLFTEFDNFGQTTLTSKNLKGSLSANIYELSVQWDKDYKLIENSIYNKTNMKIENGELMDYEPLEALSGFVDINDLKHIKFSTLENEVEIKDRVIHIPAMTIESSAMDLMMSGKHTFDDVIDYQFKLSLADVLVRKFLGGNKQKETYEEDAEGGVNVYISMTGTVTNPVIKYNKKEAKQKLQDSGLEEQKFIDIFKPDPDEKLFRQNEPEKKKTEEEPEEIEFIEFDDEM